MSPVQFIDYITTVDDTRERSLLNRILENYLYGVRNNPVTITELQLLSCCSLAVVLLLIANYKNHSLARTMFDAEKITQYFSEVDSSFDDEAKC